MGWNSGKTNESAFLRAVPFVQAAHFTSLPPFLPSFLIPGRLLRTLPGLPSQFEDGASLAAPIGNNDAGRNEAVKMARGAAPVRNVVMLCMAERARPKAKAWSPKRATRREGQIKDRQSY